jgi:L-2,4-diaminobutyrate decarboxylase
MIDVWPDLTGREDDAGNAAGARAAAIGIKPDIRDWPHYRSADRRVFVCVWIQYAVTLPRIMTQLLQQVFDPQAFRTMGHEMIDLLANYLEQNLGGQQDKPYQWTPPEEQLHFWQQQLDQRDTSPLAFFDTVLQRSMQLHHPHYMGHQVAVPAPAAALAALMSALLNNGTAVYEMGSVSTAMERIIIATTAKAIGYADTASGFLTSGGTLANLTALLAARQQMTPDDVWEKGTPNNLAIMVSEEAHYCVQRAVRIMGLGSAGLLKVPVREDYSMDTTQLQVVYDQAVAAGKRVIAIVGSACSTSTGAYDDLEAIGQFCKSRGCWFHVDGAHGGAVIFSAKYRGLVKGIALADSMILDYHKMLLTPALVTALVFKNGDHSYQIFSQRAQYLWERSDERDWYNLARRTFECTKSMMALRIFTLLQLYGVSLFDETVTALYDLGAQFATLIRERPEFELPVEPVTNIVCFRFRRPTDDDSTTSLLNSRIRKQLTEEGYFYIVQTQLQGNVWLRVSLMNPFTGPEMLTLLLDRITLLAKEV